MLALRSAELQYDTTAAAKLLADGFLLSAADGTLYTKERFLKLVGDKNNPLPSDARDECRSDRSKKPDRHQCEQEHEWHKSNQGKEAQISSSAILTPRIGFHHCGLV